MKQIEVSIMGTSYRLTCPEGGEKALHDAVSRVDREMCNIRDAGKLRARERIAVLAALNLAYVLAQKNGGTPASGNAAAPAREARMDGGEAARPADPAEMAGLDALLLRLDQALEQDGHLL